MLAGGRPGRTPDHRPRRAIRSRRSSSVLRALEDVGVTAEDVTLRRPTLDEVFLQLTDRAREEVAA